MKILVVLLLGSMVQGGRCLFTCVSRLRQKFVRGWTAVSGGGRSRGCSSRCCRSVVMLLMLVLPRQLFLLVLEPLLPAQIASVLEHVPALGMQRPEGTFARFVRGTRHFDETVVEAERVPDGVLPALLILSVEWEQIHDKLIDLRQGEHLARSVLNGHRDQADVGVRWFRVGVTSTVGLVGSGTLQGRIWRVRLGKGKRIPGDTGATAWRQRTITDGAHTGTTAAHRGAPVTTHTTAAHRRHPHSRTHGAHVETPSALRAATWPDTDSHRHTHRHTSYRVDRAVCRRHAAHRGHRGAGHRAAEATSVAVQLLRLKHGHRANRCRGGGLLSACQTRIMKTAVPRLLLVMRRLPNLLLGNGNIWAPARKHTFTYFNLLTRIRTCVIIMLYYRSTWIRSKLNLCGDTARYITDISPSSTIDLDRS